LNAEVKARAVNCTQCGAPLELHGGHRVRSLSCGFCGAVLDAKAEYQVVKQFKDVKRPPMPIKLGATGKLKGIEFTVIGVLQVGDSEGYRWLEYQIFSPTHGYHWLDYSQGHFVFSRRVREIPKIGAKQKSAFTAQGMTFKVYDTYAASVYFVEGELTYVAQVGHRTTVTEGICPPYMFLRERSDEEEEYQFGEYLDAADVHKAFGLSPPTRQPNSIHAAQPYVAKPWAVSLAHTGRWFALAATVIALALFTFGNGKTRVKTKFNPAAVVKGAYTSDFSVEGTDSMMKLDLTSDQSNSWAWYDLTLFKDKVPVAELGKGISYYYGGSGEDAWSEGSTSETVYFNLPDPGTYRLHVKGTGGAGENNNGRMRNVDMHLTLNEDAIVSRYFFVLAIVLIFLACAERMMRWRFEAKRWEAVLEDDDDE
jgi:hypothetical protein